MKDQIKCQLSPVLCFMVATSSFRRFRRLLRIFCEFDNRWLVETLLL